MAHYYDNNPATNPAVDDTGGANPIEPGLGIDDGEDDEDSVPSLFSLDADDDNNSNFTGPTGSVPSTIYRHAYVNGRRYHKYRAGVYPLPNDEVEQYREEMRHVSSIELAKGVRHFAPIGEYSQKILDLGTGIGTWAMEMGEQYPSAEVVGTDLSPIQPSWVPPNVHFKIDDIEKPWLNGSNWDYVHIRHVTLTLKNVDFVCQQIFDNLKPGGWIEFQELGGIFKCDDETMPQDSKVRQFFEIVSRVLGERGMRWDVANFLDEYLARAGFVNIQCKKFKCPIGIWPRGKRLRVVGMFMRDVIDELFVGLSPRVLPGSGMSEQEQVEFAAAHKEEIANPDSHIYLDHFFWFAQKPTA